MSESVNLPSFDTLRVNSHNNPISPSRRGSPSRTNSPNRAKSVLRESISSSKLYRDLSPTRVFSSVQAQDTARTSLPSLFSPGKSYLKSLRPHYSFDIDGLQEDDSRQPKLLLRLEALLEEKLSAVGRVGAASQGFAATQMRVEAHRQVFDAFLHSFTTYRSLLLRIKHEYDVALDDALASVYDNVHMRAELAVAEERLDAAIRAAQKKALEDAALSRKEIQDEVEQQEALAVEAEQRCQAAESEISAIKANIKKLRAEEAELLRQNNEAKMAQLQKSVFCTQSLMKHYQPKPPPSGKD